RPLEPESSASANSATAAITDFPLYRTRRSAAARGRQISKNRRTKEIECRLWFLEFGSWNFSLVSRYAWIHVQRPGINSARHVLGLVISLLPQELRHALAATAVMAVNDNSVFFRAQ